MPYDKCEMYMYIHFFPSSDNGKPAIIGSKLGNGCGILSGVHFEYDPYLLEKQIYNVDPKNNGNIDAINSYEFIETLKTNNSSRLKLFETLITLLLNPDNESVLMK
ncbi:unnamed protein product [Schistosoma mattheei]|uniref:Uncharacterized protein n=1 Tax=Schistosoma mattheei TaxID=31246 RepID=A0A183P633_9TREM|nr:unnamed protein product [Schistosoma mattheei]